jgi:hypothetical protein
MFKFFIYYTGIGLILAPFVYFNNAYQYREDIAGGIGYALGGAFYWPSYLFSVEPTLNSDSVDSFEKSIATIIDYRNNKLFSGNIRQSHSNMVVTAIGNCLALEGKKNNSTFIYDQLLSDDENPEIKKVRSAIMEQMDGYDFADIINAGVKCGKEYHNL